MTKEKNRTLLVVAALALISTVTIASLGLAQSKAKPDPKQFARGAKAWSQTCARCHNIRSAKDNSDEDWRVSVMHMRVRANIPGDVARDIEAFLRATN